jgi:hypothetical protein
MFLFLFALHVPLGFIYSSYGNYEGALQTLSLGNLGFSSSNCLIESVLSSKSVENPPTVNLKCHSGQITQLIDFGITTKFENQHSCSRQVNTQYCNKFIHDTNFREYFSQ